MRCATQAAIFAVMLALAASSFAGQLEDGKAAYDRQHYAMALRLLQPLAADQGSPPAQFLLGDMYADGRGVPKDYVAAYEWYHISLAHGMESASERIAVLAGRMSSAQIADAQRLSRDWKPTTR